MAIKSGPKTIRPKKISSNPMLDTVRNLYTKNAPGLLFEAILFAAASVLIFMHPVQTLTTLTLIFGIIMTMFGLYQLIVVLFGERGKGMGRGLHLILGAINMTLGIIFFVNPTASVYIIVAILAVFFLLRSLLAFIMSINMWRLKIGHYVIDTLLAIIAIILAILILFNPAFGAMTIMYFIASTLGFYAISDVYMYIELLRWKRRLS